MTPHTISCFPQRIPEGESITMVSDVPAGTESNLGWLLRGLVEHVPHTRSAVLLSADGLATASYGLAADPADQLSAIASGLFSLARTAAVRFGGSDGVRQVVAELDDTLMFVSSAGFGSVLTVLADREADAGVIGYEMAQMVKSVRPFLATPARQPGAAAGIGTPAHGATGPV
jgi:predicted regulator of Ras-like GTPase activity (Roadblock/LC7/MglB family)